MHSLKKSKQNKKSIKKSKGYWGKKIKPDTDFIFGYGSLINDKSRMQSNIELGNPIPVRISKKFGYRRCWNFQSPTAKLTALGIEKTTPKNGATINGIICSVKKQQVNSLDEREQGYTRIKIPKNMVETVNWISLPKSNINIWIYIPNGKNGKPGIDLYKANKYYPMLQTYIDVCLNGLLKYGKDFTMEFLETTFEWSKYWLNEREISRRPWIHEKNYKIIDNLLEKYPVKKNHFNSRQLEAEYCVYFSKQILNKGNNFLHSPNEKFELSKDESFPVSQLHF